MRGAKEYDFVVTLKHPNYKLYNLITVLISVLTIAAEIFGLLQTPFFNYTWLNVFLLAIIIVSFVVAAYNLDKPAYIVTFKWALYAAAFLWLLYPLHIPAVSIFFIIAALLERQIKFPQEIGFSKEVIAFNTFPFKSYAWSEVKNAMLKDDMLTLDFTNNKIIQKETEAEVSSETEKEFNEFCRQRLNTLQQ